MYIKFFRVALFSKLNFREGETLWSPNYMGFYKEIQNHKFQKTKITPSERQNILWQSSKFTSMSFNITSRTQRLIGCKWRIDWFFNDENSIVLSKTSKFFFCSIAFQSWSISTYISPNSATITVFPNLPCIVILYISFCLFSFYITLIYLFVWNTTVLEKYIVYLLVGEQN